MSHLQLGPISLPSRSQYPRLISIQVTSRLPSRSRQLHITSIQVPSHHQPRPDIHVSSPARSRYSCLTIQFTCHPHLHSANCISASSRSHLIPYRPQGFCLTSIKAPFHSHPYLKICISPASRFHLICTQVSRFSYHLSVTSPLLSSRQDCISPASRSHLTPSRFLNLCLASMQVTFHLHPGPDIRVTPPFRSHLGSIQVLIQVPRIASQLHPSPISPHPGQKTCVSPPSKYHLTCIRVPVFMSHSHLLLCHDSPPFRSQESRLSSIHVPSYFIHLLNFICDSPPSRLCLTSIQNLIEMHKGPNMHLSPTSMLRLTSIQVIRTASHPPPGLRMCVSPQSRSRLSSVQILIFVSHLYTGRISPPLRS